MSGDARRLQRLVQDETGVKPKYTACLRVLQTSLPKPAGMTWEEFRAKLFTENRDQLVASAEAP